MTLDNGREFDLTSDSFADDGNLDDGSTATHQFLRRGQQGGSGSSSKRANNAAKGTKKGKRTARDGRGGSGRPMEAEFRDK